MTNTSKPILFFGTEDFSALFLQALITEGYDIRAVVTKPDSRKGRGQQIVEPQVKTIAHQAGIAVWQPTKLAEIASDIQALGDVAGVLVAYGKIIPGSIIQLFTPGIINVHPSLLPKYRGPSPIEAAILHGDLETGVSIMQLVKAMDAGPVYSQITVPLTGAETKAELYAQLGERAKTQLLEVLPAILGGDLQPTPQDETEATYCHMIQKSDGALDWHKPAEQLEREIRAYAGWPRSFTELAGMTVYITSAHLARRDEAAESGVIFANKKQLFIGASTGWIEILTLQPQGKKEMPVQAFLAGYHDKL